MQETPKVEKATAKDFEEVYPLLLGFENPNISKEQWKLLFTDNWGFQKEYCGYKLVVGEEIVGFIAYILSQKLIDGQREKFCNISSWIVKPEYRNSSIDLLYPLLELKDHTIISFTPTEGAYKVETKLFKLKILDVSETILPVVPCLSALFKRKINIFSADKVPASQFEQLLSDHEKTIFHHHKPYNCHHVVITTPQGPLYLIYKKIYKRHLPFARVYYVNDPELFSRYLKTLRVRLPLALKMAGLVVDSRYMKDHRFRFKKTKNFPMPMLYKSARLKPQQVDYLYSEIFLLDL